jgi:DivIVA domain-containing protein
VTSDHPWGTAAHGLARRLSPEQVRSAGFDRAHLGRRGFDEVEVSGFLAQVAEELAQRDAEIGRLTGENRQLKHALREWHRQLVGYDAAELVARTQQHVEAQIAQAEAYSREREEEASQRYEEIIAEARRGALVELQRLGPEPGTAPLGAGPVGGIGSDDRQEWLVRQQAYSYALVQALDALAAHVHATRQWFTFEVSRLGDIGEGRDGSDGTDGGDFGGAGGLGDGPAFLPPVPAPDDPALAEDPASPPG